MKANYFAKVVTGILVFAGLNLNAQINIYTITETGIQPTESISESQRNIMNIGDNSLQLNYAFNSLSVADITAKNGANYDLIRLPSFGLSGKVGYPSLPVRTEKIAIPDNTIPQVSVKSSKYIELKGFNIYPAQEMPTDNFTRYFSFAKNQEAYNTNSYIPETLSEVIEQQTYRGVTMGYLQIRPVQYNPVNGKIRIYTELSVQVDFATSKSKTTTTKKSTQKNADLSLLNNIVLNPVTTPKSSSFSKAATVVQPKGYIIVTISEFITAAQQLATWKQQLGYHVEILSQTSWTISQAKNAIRDIYYNSPYNYEYLTLIGDQEHIPDYFFRIENLDLDIYSTNYYACMDEGYDYMPEMAHGRISIRDAAQAELVVQKIINYEKNPPLEESFYNKGLHAGYFQDSARDGISDKRYARTTIEMYEYMTQQQGFESDLVLYAEPDVVPNSFLSYYSGVTTLPDEYHRENGYAWDGDKYDIISAINEGRLYAFHRDHGKVDGWMAPEFNLDDIDQLANGNKLPLVFSVNCGSGLFFRPEPSSICFAERMQRHPNGGAIGVIAATEETRSGYNDGLIIGMMDAIWSDPGIIPDLGSFEGQTPTLPAHDPIYTLGDIMIHGLIRMSETWDPLGWADDDHFHLYHLFGDPATRIWTQVPVSPEANHQLNLQPSATTFEIYSSNCPGGMATICVDGTLSGQAILDNGAGIIPINATLTETSEVVVTLSAPNYRPYIANILVSNDPPIRIMPLGNSVTFDQRITETRSDGEKISYRKDLYDLLREYNVTADFVGSETSGNAIFPDAENAGFPGMNSAELLHLLQTGYNQHNGVQETNGYYLDEYNPDVILLHIGTKRLTPNTTDVALILNEIDAYKTRSGIDTKIILAKIINQVPINADVTQFNTNLEQLVTARSDASIFLVDMEQSAGLVYAISPGGDMYDTYHPTDTGFTKMAQEWIDPLLQAIDVSTDEPVLMNVKDISVLHGEKVYADMHATANEKPTLSITGLTSNMTFNADLGILWWSAQQSGIFNFTITATNSSGSVSQDFTVTVSNENEAPIAPSNLLAELQPDNSIALTWNDNSTNETGFEIEQSLNSGDFTLLQTIDANTNSYTASSTLPGTNYIFRVLAVNENGSSNHVESANIFVPIPEEPQVVGYDEVFPTQLYNNNRRAQRVTMPADGLIHTISMYHSAGGGSLLYAVYSNVNNQPGSLLAVTPITRVSNSSGWQEVALTEPIEVSAGTDIWLSWVYEYSPEIRYASGGSGRANSSEQYASGMPQNFGASSVSGYMYSIHALYDAIVQNPVPQTPNNLQGTFSEAEPQNDLIWTDNASDETGFTIERSLNGGAYTTLINNLGVNANSYSDTDIEYNNDYSYRVFAVNNNGSSPYSNSITVNTDYVAPTIPDAPTALTLTPSIYGPSIRIEWQDNSNNEDNFLLERSVNGGDFELFQTLLADTIDYLDIDIDYDITYSYRVIATNAIGISNPSNTEEVTIITPPPPVAPTAITAQLVGMNIVEISWRDESINETRFEIERSVNGGIYSLLNTIAGNNESTRDTVELSNTNYRYRVRAANYFGNSDYIESSEIFVPEPTVPNAPTELNLVYNENIPSISLEWLDNSNDEDNFLVERSMNGGAFELLQTIPTNSTSHTDLAIAYGNTYQYRVIAANIIGNSNPSNTEEVINIIPAAPAAPTNVALQLSSTNSIVITWVDQSVNETGFEVERSVNGGSFSAIASTSENIQTVIDIVPQVNTNYTYRVRAIHNYGSSEFVESPGIFVPENTEPQIIGYDDIMSTQLYNANRRAQQVTMTENGTIESISMYHGSGGGSMILGIYDNASNRPGNLIARTPSTRVNSSNGWQEIELENPVFVEAGSTLWLAWIYQYAPEIRYSSGGSERAHSSDTWSAGMPNYFGSSSVSSYQYSIYASYQPVVTNPTPVAPGALSYTYDEDIPNIDLTWADNAGDELGFVIERSVNGGGYSQLVNLAANTVAYTDNSITHNAQYEYQIYAYNANGNSVYSNSISVNTEYIPPVPPTAPSSIAAQYNNLVPEITLNWTDEADNETGFEIGRSVNGIGFNSYTSLTANTASFTDSDISYGNTYQYQIFAYNTFGGSTLVNSLVITASVPEISPAAPSNLNITYDNGIPAINIHWTDNAMFENGFVLERDQNSGGYATIATLNQDESSFEDLDISHNQDYTYRVQAFNSFGNSSFSNTANIFTAEPSTNPIQVGYTSLFPTRVLTAYRRAQAVTTTAAGSIESISMYMDPVNNGNYRFAVYDDNNGYPGELLAQSAVTPKNSTESWHTAALSPAPEIAANQQIWLAWMFDQGTVVFYTSGSPGRAHSGQFWSSSFPSSFGSSSIASYNYSIYMTMIPDNSKEVKTYFNINASTELSIYPNPIQGDVINYSLKNLESEGRYVVEIQDLSGRLIHNESVWIKPGKENQMIFNHQLESAILLFKISNNEQTYIQKIAIHQ